MTGHSARLPSDACGAVRVRGLRCRCRLSRVRSGSRSASPPVSCLDTVASTVYAVLNSRDTIIGYTYALLSVSGDRSIRLRAVRCTVVGTGCTRRPPAPPAEPDAVRCGVSQGATARGEGGRSHVANMCNAVVLGAVRWRSPGVVTVVTPAPAACMAMESLPRPGTRAVECGKNSGRVLTFVARSDPGGVGW